MDDYYLPSNEISNQQHIFSASKSNITCAPFCNFVINTIIGGGNFNSKPDDDCELRNMQIKVASKNDVEDICESAEMSIKNKVEKYLEKLDEAILSAGISSTVYVNIGVNKLKSMNDEENNLFKNEVQYLASSEKRYSFEYKINHFFWEPTTFDDRINWQSKGEVNFKIPFQKIREYLKKHSDTTYFIEKCRKNNNAPVYLCFFDADTLDFNNVFEEYLRIVQEDKVPTIMTTGFQYPWDEEYGYAFQFASRYEMAIRSFINKIFPLGTYISERNMCVLVENEKNNLHETETFTDANRGKGGFYHESPILITNIVKNRGGDFTCVFSEKNPILTEIPNRIKKNKRAKRQANERLVFTEEFMNFCLPSEEDFECMEKITESHLDKFVLRDGLFCNGKLKKYKMLQRYAFRILLNENYVLPLELKIQFALHKDKQIILQREEIKAICVQLKQFMGDHKTFFTKLTWHIQSKNIDRVNYDIIKIFDLSDEVLKSVMNEQTNTRSETLYNISQDSEAMNKLLEHIRI